MDKNITGGLLTDVPNESYKKFFDKFNEIQTLTTNEWKPVHVLAYFCQRYELLYNKKYQFKFNSSAPSKCFEVFNIKKLSNFLSSDPQILKEYIDWVFETKIIKAKRRITSISFISNEQVVNEYKLNHLLNPKEKISRTTNIPDKYKSIIKNDNINTYGDLAFIFMMGDSMPEEFKLMFDNLRKLGLDTAILSNII